MSNNNQFQPYRYQQSENVQQPSQSGLNLSAGGGRPGRQGGAAAGPLVRLLKRPAFATLALLLGAATVAVIVMMSSSGGDSNSDVPIVRADARPIREAPEQIGGMVIPNADSTIYQAARLNDLKEPAPIENLLSDDETPVSRLDAFANEAKLMMEKTPPQSQDSDSVDADSILITIDENNNASVTPSVNANEARVAVVNEKIAAAAPVAASDPIVTPSATLSVVPASKPKSNLDGDSRLDDPKPTQSVAGTFPAGASPDTLAFVRSVLDKKESAQSSVANKKAAAEKLASEQARAVAKVKPAAGTPADAKISITSGDYYVQLASVKSRDGAYGEWTKLKKTFSNALSAADYRVKQADLGERGIFYRIQAGPMSKSSANAVCTSIKSTKPNGCLVTR